ncbi:MAG: hypothetical protein EBQ99_00855 [Planctomycetes bacterium]|nr:hypothetical protein [Planctomycetota bacterium]
MKNSTLRATTALATLSISLIVAAAAQQAAPAGKEAPAAAKAGKPMSELAQTMKQFAFMEGRWTQQQPNGAVIEEHWMAPRGNTMVGTFRRTLGNGVTPFYELTQIMAESDMVILRQIHVHGDFEPDPKRTDLMRLRLDKVEGTSVTFVPVDPPLKANAQDMASIRYQLTDPDTLVLTVTPNPPKDPAKAPGAPLVFTMKRMP